MNVAPSASTSLPRSSVTSHLKHQELWSWPAARITSLCMYIYIYFLFYNFAILLSLSDVLFCSFLRHFIIIIYMNYTAITS